MEVKALPASGYTASLSSQFSLLMSDSMFLLLRTIRTHVTAVDSTHGAEASGLEETTTPKTG